MANPLFRAHLRDAEDSTIAVVTRHVYEAESLDYVAIKNGDSLITVSVEDVPEFLRAVMRAAAVRP